MRSSQKSRGGIHTAVLQSARREKRRGWCMASQMPVMPPIERPQNAALLDLQRVEQVEHVLAEPLQRVVAVRRFRLRRGRAGRSG